MRNAENNQRLKGYDASPANVYHQIDNFAKLKCRKKTLCDDLAVSKVLHMFIDYLAYGALELKLLLSRFFYLY